MHVTACIDIGAPTPTLVQITSLEAELADADKELRLRTEMEGALKEALREAERRAARNDTSARQVRASKGAAAACQRSSLAAACTGPLRGCTRHAAHQHARCARDAQVDMEYLKNLVLQLYTTGEAEALLPVFSALLAFSPDEAGRAKQVCCILLGCGGGACSCQQPHLWACCL